jgi:hypothetical protein
MRKLFTVLATANARLGRSVANHQGRFARRNGRLLVRPLSLRVPPVLGTPLRLLRLSAPLSLALLTGTSGPIAVWSDRRTPSAPRP